MRKHQIARCMTAAMMAALPVFPAAAARFELQGGVSYMGNPANGYDAPAVFGEYVFDPRQIGSSRFTWSPDVIAGWIGGRNLARFDAKRYSTRDAIGLIGGGVRLHYGLAGDWYRRFFLSFQPALHTGRTQSLSSVYQFVTTAGYQGDRWSLGVRHISNGGFHQPNRGETMLLVGVAF
jgi:hypothetical protein